MTKAMIISLVGYIEGVGNKNDVPIGNRKLFKNSKNVLLAIAAAQKNWNRKLFV
jgi:hypothetical protein